MHLRRNKKNPGTYDIHTRPSRTLTDFFRSPRTVNLRKKIYKRYPLLTIGFIFLLIPVLFFAGRKLFIRAEVADFYPGTCLGTWQNPAHAQREPETWDAVGSTFTDANSALFSGTSSQIFCGGFVPEDFLPAGEIKNVGITLVWQVGEKEPSRTVSTSTPMPPESATTTTENASSSSTPIESSSTISLLLRGLNRFVILPVFAQTAPEGGANETTTIEAPPSSASLETSTASTSTQEPASTTQAVSAPVTQESASGTSTATTTTTATNGLASTTEKSIPSPSVPTDAMSEPPPEEPSNTIVTSVVPEALDAAASSTAASSTVDLEAPEPPPDENFLEVRYSTDGQAWIEIAKVNPNNWEHFTVTLPITTWDDVKRVQLRIEGIPTALAEIPKVYLDGMLMEVHYELPPVFNSSPGPEMFTNQETSVIQVPPKPVMKIFDPEAKHKCSITPFSQSVKKGGTATYTVILTPSSQNLHFTLETGDLPPGVSAAFTPQSKVGSSTSQLVLNASGNAERGSFDVVAIYREIDQNLKILANFCQLNLIIND